MSDSKPACMKLILITGLSGSGKSVALRALEDSDFYCIDNLPPRFIHEVVHSLQSDACTQVAIAIDCRTGKDLSVVPDTVSQLKTEGFDVRILFLDAEENTLVTRYSETRRRHPMNARLSELATVQECVQAEREALVDIKPLADLVDTSAMLPTTLRRWVLDAVHAPRAKLTLIFETFGFKTGLPKDADLVFDVRCLTNPYYDKNLRPLNGKDKPVQTFIQNDARSNDLLNDIEQYLRKWLPHYQREQRSYITVAIGCTGGQHRSVYIAEMLNKRFTSNRLIEVEHVLVRHRNTA